MPEATQISFSPKEIVELLIRKHGLRKGLWGLSVRFGLKAINIGPDAQTLAPAAIVSIVEIGLAKAEEESNLAVDAAKVEALPERPKRPKRQKK